LALESDAIDQATMLLGSRGQPPKWARSIGKNRLRELGFGTTGQASFATYLSSPLLNSMTMRKIFWHRTVTVPRGFYCAHCAA